MVTEKIFTWWAVQHHWQIYKVNKLSHYWNKYSNSWFILLGNKATQSWYDEIKDYSFARPGFSAATGHFTQVVWKGSSKLGVGIAFADNGRKAIVVANYSPPGNYQGQFPQNVLQAQC